MFYIREITYNAFLNLIRRGLISCLCFLFVRQVRLPFSTLKCPLKKVNLLFYFQCKINLFHHCYKTSKCTWTSKLSIRFYLIKLSHIGLNKTLVLFRFFEYETLIKSKLKRNVARYYKIKISKWSFSIIVCVKRIPEPLTQFLEKAHRRDYNKPVQGGLSPKQRAAEWKGQALWTRGYCSPPTARRSRQHHIMIIHIHASCTRQVQNSFSPWNQITLQYW